MIKFTHNSGNTIVVDDKAVIDREAIEARCQKALADRYIGQYTNERWYLHVMPQVVIEKRLRDAIHDIPLDYKFFVFRGRVATIQVDYGRFTNHTRTFYSPSWQREPFGLKYPAGPDLERPARLDEMLGIAETLGKDFPFARIDLYLIDNRDIRFGEITLAPEAGLGRFTPDDMDVELGRLWKNSL